MQDDLRAGGRELLLRLGRLDGRADDLDVGVAPERLAHLGEAGAGAGDEDADGLCFSAHVYLTSSFRSPDTLFFCLPLRPSSTIVSMVSIVSGDSAAWAFGRLRNQSVAFFEPQRTSLPRDR